MADKSEPNYVRVIISYKEYSHLKTIEAEYQKSEKVEKEKLQLKGIL